MADGSIVSSSSSSYMRSWRQRRIDAATCLDCDSPAAPNRRRCEVCLEKERFRSRAKSRGLRKRVSDDPRAECRRLRADEQLALDDIADRTGISKSTIALIVADIPHPPRRRIATRSGAEAEARLPERLFAHLSTFQKGKLAELYFEAECIKRGIAIFKPVLDARYDYLISVGGAYRRIQVKWSDGRSSRQHGTVSVALSRSRGNRRSVRDGAVAVYDKDEIDFVVAYLPCIDNFVILGPDVFHRKVSIILRIDAPRNRQRKKLRFASDLIWGEVL